MPSLGQLKVGSMNARALQPHQFGPKRFFGVNKALIRRGTAQVNRLSFMVVSSSSSAALEA